ncbi:MAG: hypothetical protein HY456_01470 [Parcubacteria group bacterium]|nr:hypothetical protein [Parcubacteria group bacterium]
MDAGFVDSGGVIRYNSRRRGGETMKMTVEARPWIDETIYTVTLKGHGLKSEYVSALAMAEKTGASETLRVLSDIAKSSE